MIGTKFEKSTEIMLPNEICSGPSCWLAGKKKQSRTKLIRLAKAKSPSDILIGSIGVQK